MRNLGPPSTARAPRLLAPVQPPWSPLPARSRGEEEPTRALDQSPTSVRAPCTQVSMQRASLDGIWGSSVAGGVGGAGHGAPHTQTGPHLQPGSPARRALPGSAPPSPPRTHGQGAVGSAALGVSPRFAAGQHSILFPAASSPFSPRPSDSTSALDRASCLCSLASSPAVCLSVPLTQSSRLRRLASGPASES